MQCKTYFKSSDNGRTIIGYLTGCNEVKDTWGDAKKIASGAFRDCIDLISFVVPSVTEIESYAFCGCFGLRSVVTSNRTTHIGNNAFEGCTSLTSIGISRMFINKIENSVFKDCSSITKIKIPISVKEIGNSAFEGCTSLTTVEIPSNVTKIGERAFYGCTSLSSIEIPRSVTKIGKCAFANCTSLTTVEIPDHVKEIGWGAFENCFRITNFFVDADNPNYCDVDGVLYTKDLSKLLFVPNKFEKFIVPNTVKEIGELAFTFCTNLISIEIPNCVTEIGKSAFGGCTSLTSIRIPGNVTKIGERAFSTVVVNLFVEADNPNYCAKDGVLYSKDMSELLFVPNNFDSFIVPNSVTKIRKEAFNYCTSLTSVEIPDSVVEIEYGAFIGSTNLKEIHLKRNYSVDSSLAFNGLDLSKITLYVPYSSADSYQSDYKYKGFKKILINTKQFEYLSLSDDDKIVISCKKDYKGVVKIPNSVTVIDRKAFEGCTDITSIEIPYSVMEIRSRAFEGCTSLTSIEIPSSVTIIGESAFLGCSGIQLINVDDDNPNYCDDSGNLYTKDMKNLIFIPNKYDTFVVPSSVTKIEPYAFFGCTKLSIIDFPSSVSEIGFSAFKGCDGLTSLEIPNSVTRIMGDTFSGCSSLTTITIPSSVAEIESYAFTGCTNLTSIEIPNSVTKIGTGAFENCKSLTSIKLPNRVKVIEEMAFKGCEGLIDLHLRIKETIDFSAAFEGLDLSKITLYVPIGTGFDYRDHRFYRKFKKVVTEK